MKIPRANFKPVDTGASTPPDEIEVAREPVILMTHDMVLSLDPTAGLAVVRVFSKGETAKHIGLPPERAVRVGEALIRAGRRLMPKDADAERQTQ